MRRYSLFVLVLLGCASPGFTDIPGFAPEVNVRLREFFKQTQNETGRKVAVFDGDGTVLGQVPHYLADECMYKYADAHPEKHPGVIREIKPQSNVSIPYVQGRVRFLAGESPQKIRDLGDECFKSDYSTKIFPQMKALIQLLKKNGFEVWIVTASPEALYQTFLSRELGLSPMNILGVKSVVRNDILTDEMIQPIPQEEGKRHAIETFIQAQPLLAGGNSRGDREMIEYSRGLRMIVNPDTTPHGNDPSLAEYAKKHDWLTVRIRDVEEAGFPGISSRKFGIRKNATHDVP
ncbi:MAG: haloacid dehalogenase-like hydrolase [Leptospirales bacterium]|nr:haloacid dehalogenase-like hydrolase [Leptospirales bacterium]